MIEIDGRQGEGGGQVLRTSVGLAAALGVSVRVDSIRAGRKQPGLLRQHLTAVKAAAQISGGRLEGAHLGSTALELHPGTVQAGSYHFAIGSAGSAVLVLQTVLPALLVADGPSHLVLEGGTHNQWAPPFDFLEATLLPTLARTGAQVEVSLVRAGFFPAGGGEIQVQVTPAASPARLVLVERGAATRRVAAIHAAHLPDSVPEREGRFLRQELKWWDGHINTVQHDSSRGGGNAICMLLGFEQIDEVVTGFGERGVPAKRVSRSVARQARRYLGTQAPVGEHLADQLLAPLAVLAGGVFRTLNPSSHTLTNAKVVQAFLPDSIEIEELGPEDHRVTVRAGRD